MMMMMMMTEPHPATNQRCGRRRVSPGGSAGRAAGQTIDVYRKGLGGPPVMMWSALMVYGECKARLTNQQRPSSASLIRSL